MNLVFLKSNTYFPKLLILALFISVLTTSCGGSGGGGGSSASAPTKSILSVWSTTTDSGATLRLDLRQVELDQDTTVSFIDSNGAIQCACPAIMNGDEINGTYDMDCRSCSAPYNAINVEAGTYTVSSSNVATFCDIPSDSSSCQNYL